MNGKSGDTEKEQRQRIAAKVEERRRWAELREVYLRCVAIAEQAWNERLDAAQATQQQLAEQMRDREESRHYTDGKLVAVNPGEIPVPLFTPRDRQQFLKEVAATLLISADRRNLGATPEPKPVEETAPEAASGTDEGLLDQEAEEVAGQGDVRERAGQTGGGVQSPEVVAPLAL
jgi:hypothetical protein